MTAIEEPVPAVSASPAAGKLYDTRRGVYYTKPVLRGWLHLLWFAASLVCGPLLLARGTERRGSRRPPSTRPA